MIKGVLRWVYKNGFARLPAPGRKIFSAIDYRLASRPRIYHDPQVHPAARLATGTVTFSLDFELAWAWQFAKSAGEDPVAKGLRERAQVPRILSWFDEFSIPATWATVGHLFLERCSRENGRFAHAEMPRIPPFETEYWRFDKGDWYANDPCTDVSRDPAWYAPDLVESVLAAPAGHEIACHSFSHVGFGSYCPADVAAAEVEACREAMRSYGLSPTTWVFPANDVGNLETLVRGGIEIIRAFPRPSAKITLPVQRADRMWSVHVSSAIDRGKGWSLEERLTRLKRFVTAAGEARMNAHIWLHPSLHPDLMHFVLFPLLRFCAEERDRGNVEIVTMKELVRATSAAAMLKQSFHARERRFD